MYGLRHAAWNWSNYTCEMDSRVSCGNCSGPEFWSMIKQTWIVAFVHFALASLSLGHFWPQGSWRSHLGKGAGNEKAKASACSKDAWNVYDYTLVVLSGADIVALEMHQNCTRIHWDACFFCIASMNITDLALIQLNRPFITNLYILDHAFWHLTWNHECGERGLSALSDVTNLY